MRAEAVRASRSRTETISRMTNAALRIGAHGLAALVSKALLPDERAHLAEGLRDVVRTAPERAAREAAFQRALADVLPPMLPFTSDADVPCARACDACSGRCLELDACAGDVSLAGGWSRMSVAIEDAARRVGVLSRSA